METKTLILVAEDEHLIGLDVQQALEDEGFAVRHVASGGEAIDAIANELPKIIGVVTDIRLGAGPDGWEVARMARETNMLVPIVYMSGDSAHQHSSLGVANSAMIQKPFAAEQIVTALTQLMDGCTEDRP